MNEENSVFEKVNNWIKNSISLKLITITILMLLLLIPVSMIDSIISEREDLHREVINEVNSKWAENQQINGPVLTIPLIYRYDSDEKVIETTKYLFILPEKLKINGKIEPEKLHRGIYEVVVYRSDLTVTGDFLIDVQIDQENLKEIKYDQAFLTVGITDLRGIKNEINFKWGNEILKVSPGSRVSNVIYSGITVDVPDLEKQIGKPINFEFVLDLQGSQNMSFVPIGSTTEVKISSVWESPSFSGNFLPDSREVNQKGFTAEWKILQLNRNFPQTWIGNKDEVMNMTSSAFGIDLILPVNNYQKSTRSAKYAVMTIALTFLIFFLVEILNKRKVHPFQYALIGFGLCLFYVLLVSITEHSNFNFAYGISTVGIVSMISLYSINIFKRRKLTMLLISTLIGIYGFLFVTLQMADYALLMGSLGLTVILAATMYFTRNINWYNLKNETD